MKRLPLVQRLAKGYVTDIRKKWSLPEWILFAGAAAVLLIMIRYIFTAGNIRLHSDSASIILYAEEMRKKGQLFPNGWYYGTTISLLPFPVCFFLELGADYLLARDLGQFLFALLMLFSVILFSRKYFQNNSWLLLVLFLFSYISDTQYQEFFVEAAYASQIFLIFFSLTCFIASVELDPDLHLRKRKLGIFLFYTVCTAFLGSIFLQQTFIPLCTALFVLYMQDKSSPPRETSYYNKDGAVKEIRYTGDYKWVGLAIFSTTLIGLLLYMKLCSNINIGGNPALVTFKSSFADYIENLSEIAQALLMNTGIRGNVSLFSLAGVQNVLGLVLTACMWIIFPIRAFRNFKYESKRNQAFFIFTFVHVAEVLILLLFCSAPLLAKARYMLSSLALLSTVSSNYLYEHYIKGNKFTKIVSSMLLVLIMCILTLPGARLGNFQQALTQMRALTDYLEGSGLRYGYGSYWNSHKYSALSEGKVQVRPVNFSRVVVSPALCLASEDWYDPECYKGETFILLLEEEAVLFAPAGYDNTMLGPVKDVLNYPPFTILVYDHNISENNFNYILNGKTNLLGMAACSDNTMRQENGSVFIDEGQIMYGPYIPLDAGGYNLLVDLSSPSPVEIVISATDTGGEVLGIFELNTGRNECHFTLEENHTQIEFVIRNQTAQTVHVTDMYLLLEE